MKRTFATLLAIVLVITITPAIASEQTVDILRKLDGEFLQTASLYSGSNEQLPSSHKEFLRIVREVYSERDINEIQSQLSIALFSDVYFSDELEYYGLQANIFRDSAASTIKTVLLAAVLHFCETGQLSYEQVVDDFTVEEHCRRMITQSSNDSANTLLQELGYKPINSWLSELGFKSTELHFGRLFKPTKYEIPSTDTENVATALGLAKFYFLLSNSTDVSGFLSALSLNKAKHMLGTNWLNTQRAYNDRLNYLLPEEVTFYHKTGSNAEVLGDGGIFSYKGDKYILVVFDSGQDRDAMQEFGARIYDFMRTSDL